MSFLTFRKEASLTTTTDALGGIRVVEYGGMISAAYAAKLMADLGADVIKVEPPEGDPSRLRGPFPPGLEDNPEASGLFLYLNANKRGVTLDLTVPGDREQFRALLADADVFIHNVEPGPAAKLEIDYETLAADLPKLVYTSITPYGLSGPHANWHGDNLTVVSAGGWASVTPGNSTDPDLPPLVAQGQQADFQAALHGSVATMGALFARRRTGRGQLVEVSAQECIAAALELAFVTYTYTGAIASRLGVSYAGVVSGIMGCSDGFIYIIAPQEHQWDAFVELMGHPDWADLEIFQDRISRGQNADALQHLVEEWLREHTVEEVFELSREWRLPFAPVSQIGDLLNSPHLKARGFFATTRHPVAGEVRMPREPYEMPATPWALRRPAPTLGEHNEEVRGAATKEAVR